MTDLQRSTIPTEGTPRDLLRRLHFKALYAAEGTDPEIDATMDEPLDIGIYEGTDGKLWVMVDAIVLTTQGHVMGKMTARAEEMLSSVCSLKHDDEPYGDESDWNAYNAFIGQSLAAEGERVREWAEQKQQEYARKRRSSMRLIDGENNDAS